MKNHQTSPRLPLTTSSFYHALRIIVGMLVCVLIAQLCHVEFAPSTTIITLLCIQATKRDTLKAALKYAVSFLYTVGFALLIHQFFGVGLPAFFLTLLPLVLVSFGIGFQSTISVQTVVIIHLFMKQEPFTSALILNELLRVVIGVTVAVLINLSFPDKKKALQKSILAIEDSFRSLLLCLSDSFRGNDRLATAGEILKNLKPKLELGIERAYHHAGNSFSDNASYYTHYMNFREKESVILNSIVDSMLKLSALTTYPQQEEGFALIGGYFSYLAEAVPVSSSLEDAEALLKALSKKVYNQALPQTQESLAARCLLFSVVDNLNELLDKKRQFQAATPLLKKEGETKQ